MGARDWWRVAPAVAAVAWGGNHFSPLLLLYRERFGYDQVQVDLLFAVYIVGIVPGFLIAGPLSDRFGRKPLLAAGVALGVVGSVVLALDPASFPLLAAGRLISGLGVAAAMVVGSSWIKELSAPPRAAVPAATAARRASLTLTAGFGIGPAVSGALAQWGPPAAAGWLPYAVHAVLTAASAVPLATAPETRTAGRSARSGRPPAAVARRLRDVVLPAAPWVFGCAGVGFAVVPALVAADTRGWAIGYATLLAVAGLGAGAAVQPFATAIGRRTGGRQLVVGLGVAVAGLLLAALVALTASAPLGVLAALLLGAGYGLCLVSGLAEVQRAAPPQHLALLTALYYSATYAGFVLPVVLAALAAVAPEPLLLAALAVVCAGCLLTVVRALRASPLQR